MGVKFVKLPILALRPSLLVTTFVKDGKEERAVVQSAILNRVVQFGHLKSRKSEGADVEQPDITNPGGIKLFLRDVTEVFEELLPTFAEEPRFVTAAPIGVMGSAEG
jgi:hypothetical protein